MTHKYLMDEHPHAGRIDQDWDKIKGDVIWD